MSWVEMTLDNSCHVNTTNNNNKTDNKTKQLNYQHQQIKVFYIKRFDSIWWPSCTFNSPWWKIFDSVKIQTSIQANNNAYMEDITI